MTQPRNRTSLGRSFDVYYRDRARAELMDRLNRLFLPRGGLAFDIGAHLGDRTGSFLRLGARVVAAEPQPRLHRAMRLLYGRDPKVRLVQSAVGRAPGSLELFVNSQNPTVTTASADLIQAAKGSDQWQGQNWDGRIEVPVTTLDQLIAEEGTPDFVKIDVEGFEHDVLCGLSTALPALSFEVTMIQRDVALACIDRLEDLGPYSYSFSLGETHTLRHDAWQTADQMRAEILDLPNEANSGDVFARRI